MKKIQSRKTGKFLDPSEALTLCRGVHFLMNIPYVDDVASCGYPTAEIAERAQLTAMCESHEGYVFAFIGTINKPLEGYKVRVICIKDLPVEKFEKLFPEYVVIG